LGLFLCDHPVDLPIQPLAQKPELDFSEKGGREFGVVERISWEQITQLFRDFWLSEFLHNPIE
jgi:hypothetical protein